jgi:hypothetical protein
VQLSARKEKFTEGELKNCLPKREMMIGFAAMAASKPTRRRIIAPSNFS